MKNGISLILLILVGFWSNAQPPTRLTKWLISAEIHRMLCLHFMLNEQMDEAQNHYTLLLLTLDSISNEPGQDEDEQVMELKIAALQLKSQITNGEVETVLSIAPLQTSSSYSLKSSSVETMDRKRLEITVTNLQADTAELFQINRKLKSDQQLLEVELKRHTSGIFFGLGFGYNYYVKGPHSYYIKPDSSLGRYGKTSGMSFIFSGFLSYKVSPRHMVIFNVPFGDIAGRQDYRLGIFNKKMAGGLGYGYNMGSVSIIGILNVSPYEEIEFDLIQNEKFEGAKFSSLDISNYPSSVHYSPSFTIGISYNFVAPDRFVFNQYEGSGE